MFSQQNKRAKSGSGLLGRAAQALSALMQAGDHAVQRAGAQVREAMVHPLKPFPLANAAGGLAAVASSQALSAQETLMMREQHLPPGIAGLPQATLQNAHRFLTLLPTWLPMPETRRHGQGQVALEWTAGDARTLSVLIGSDGMVIYSARLGAKGRLDGAEPLSGQLSPIVSHVIRQLQD